MDNWFRSKWFVRALSLAFAVSLYIFVSVEDSPAESDMRFFESSTETATLTDVPVEIKVDDDYVVSGVPEFISATIEGSKTAVTRVERQRNFGVFVDLRGLGGGEHTVDIEYENVPNDLSVFIEPKTIDVTIEERETKEFGVTIDLLNKDKLPAGYELGETGTDPATVEITSSKSIIEKIAIVKVFVDVADMEESISDKEVPVNVYDNQGNELKVKVEPENVNVSVTVDNPSKTVPVSVETTGELPEDYDMDSITAKTNEVTLLATSGVLADINEVKTKPIDLGDIEESQTLTAEIDLPEDVRVQDKAEIEVEINLKQTRDLEDVTIDTDNLSDEQDITFVQPDQGKADITITGSQKDIADLTKDDFDLTIDADGLEEGEHVIPIDTSGPETVTYTNEPEEVTVELSQAS